MKGIQNGINKKVLLSALVAVSFAAFLLSYCGGGGGGYGGGGGVTTYRITGTVTLNGTGLNGVTMTLGGAGSAVATTAADGTYTLSGLSNGSYTITPSLSGFTFSPTSSSQTVAGTNITGVDFVATSVQTVQLVACPGSGTTDVSIVDFAFNPSSITIPANTIVKWTNNGQSTHTVTSTTVPTNGDFDSSNIFSGSSVCFKFTTAGSYNYHCTIHPTLMSGVVTVQ
jgi:plastocyanin